MSSLWLLSNKCKVPTGHRFEPETFLIISLILLKYNIANIVTTAPLKNVNKASLRPLFFLSIYFHALYSLFPHFINHQNPNKPKNARNYQLAMRKSLLFETLASAPSWFQCQVQIHFHCSVKYGSLSGNHL
jgi:hypothetical protein